jgi:hypothetical protein
MRISAPLSAHELRERLGENDECFEWKLLALPGQPHPQSLESAHMARQAANVSVREGALVEAALPGWIAATDADSGRRMVPVQTRPSSDRFQKGATASFVEPSGRLFSVSARMLSSPFETRHTKGGCGKTSPFNSAAFPSEFS